MTGISFVGGGALLKHDDSVSGTASASRIWIMGAMGAAAALGAWGYAVVLAIVNFVVIRNFARLKHHPGDQRRNDDAKDDGGCRAYRGSLRSGAAPVPTRMMIDAGNKRITRNPGLSHRRCAKQLGKHVSTIGQWLCAACE